MGPNTSVGRTQGGVPVDESGVLTPGGVLDILTRVRPTLPDTPGTTYLSKTPAADLSREVEVARRFFQAAETYLNWAQLGERLAAELGAIDAIARGDDGSLTLLEAKVQEPNGGASTERPSLRQAIRLVMATEPRVWKKSEILAALRLRGWEPRGKKPASQIATRLAEMIDRGEMERVSVGHYRLADQELRGAAD